MKGSIVNFDGDVVDSSIERLNWSYTSRKNQAFFCKLLNFSLAAFTVWIRISNGVTNLLMPLTSILKKVQPNIKVFEIICDISHLLSQSDLL